MAIPNFTEDLSIISKLGDNPGADNNLTSAQLREKFDEAGLLIQRFINDVLIPEANASGSPQEGLAMSGPIVMNGQKLSGLPEPTADGDAATKKYADSCRTAAEAYTDSKDSVTRLYAEMLAADAKQVAKKAAPYNLLDNSDFSNPVNQRGKTSYLAESGYSIDRWRTTNKITVTTDTEYKRLELQCADSASSKNGFSQRVPLDRAPKPGTKFTAAFKDQYDGVFVFPGVAPEYGARVSIGSDNSVIAGVHITLSYESEEYANFIIYIAPGKTLYLEWAALYEGEYTAETLPNYRPKGYSVELAECQRYFRVVQNGSGYAGNNAYIFFPFEFRITPTATVVEPGTIRTDGSQVVPTGVTQVDVYHNSLRLTLSGTYPGANQPAHLFSANIQLSADF